MTLLFSREQYLAAAEAYLRGIERRIAAGLNPVVWSVASVFISRWDKAVMGKCRRRVAGQARDRHRQADVQGLPRTARFAALAAAGQRRRASATPALGEYRHQRSRASDVLYIKALAAPFTINTIPEATLLAFADHGELGELLPDDGGDAEKVIAKFAKAGIDHDQLAADLQREGTESFVKVLERFARLHRVEKRFAQSCRVKKGPELAKFDDNILSMPTAP